MDYSKMFDDYRAVSKAKTSDFYRLLCLGRIIGNRPAKPSKSKALS